ncbi:MAG: HAD-IC family P-type ATPase, partial [Eggerthellaceae bacterium]|nr:HAD-IC family P-type ATPase [Eggerthellaceae bacterium]
VAVHAPEHIDKDLLLSYAAHAEAYSDHPIALSVVESYGGTIDRAIIEDVEERSGQGVAARVDSHRVLIGNDALMSSADIEVPTCHLVGTVLHVAIDDEYFGHIVIADMMKDDAEEAIAALHEAGVKRCVMLTGDREEVAAAVAGQLGIDEYRAQLMPQDKVVQIESLLEAHQGRGKVAFVGDGINDAPVLMRADVGIAMGGMGSDAAVEAADIVLMDDKPSHIARAIRIARKTMRIVKQNIVFALAVKVAIMILALPFIGIATMWLAVFGDVGVSILAILNAMRCLRTAR